MVQQKVLSYCEDTISHEIAERIRSLQKRCVNCGSTFANQIHHRVFRSEGDYGLQKLFAEKFPIYEECYGKKLIPWRLHDIQQLIVLCIECHEGTNGVHGNNEKLRQAIRNSFTCPITGFNIFYYKNKNILY